MSETYHRITLIRYRLGNMILRSRGSNLRTSKRQASQISTHKEKIIVNHFEDTLIQRLQESHVISVIWMHYVSRCHAHVRLSLEGN